MKGDGPDVMNLRVLLFASLGRQAGVRELALEVPAGCTVSEAATVLRSRVPVELGGVMCAVNERYADPSSPLADGDVLAFLPPVSGG